MSYSCLEELQLDLDLHVLDKILVLSKAGRLCNEGWFVVTDNGICYLFDKDGNLDDIKKIKQLEEKYIRQDITKIVIPDSITSIEHATFYNCYRLTSITIPDSITQIADGTFAFCSSLINVTISNGVMSIGYSAFRNCSGLMSVTIPDSVTIIGSSAFRGCIKLTSMMIPGNVTRIEYEAFKYCDALANLTFKGKTLEQVKKMRYYPWGIEDESIIKVK